ncbi:MAG: DUF1552 domain-containing protein [Deltaproteobacteria bacterium]|nr:DUF1552 domain-containing protein [Deltaproteobacteria bacterium]
MKYLDRRTFLRGAGGVALGLPFLDAMVRPSPARAQALPAAPRRIIFSFTPNGDQISRRFTQRAETTFQLDEFLQPLEPYRGDLVFIEGLRKRFGQLPETEVADSHEQGGSTLAPWPSGSGSFPVGGADRSIGYVLGPSADYSIGDRVLAANPSIRHRHLVYRVGGQGNNIWNLHSHAGPVGSQSPIAPETDPWAAYTRLFDGLDNGQARDLVVKRLAKKQSALDLVLTEIGSLRARLGAPDRLKLDRHTESLRDIERTLTAPDVGGLACRSFATGSRIDPYDDDNHQAAGFLFFKIMAMALACDYTRVIQFNWSGNTSNRVYRNLGLTEGHHDISHNGDAAAFTNVRRIHQHLWTLNTQLYEELKAIDEGNGTLWDHTLVVHWNELAQGDSHATDNSLVVLAGRAHDYFRRGRYVDLAGASHNTFSDFLSVCFQYMGFSDVQTFGDARLSSGAPVTGLTA